MTRHVIAKEGMPSIIPDLWFDKGSLWMSDEQRIFVSNAFNYELPPIGVASDLQRNDETGEVSVEIKLFNDETVDEDIYDVTFYAIELKETKVEATEDIPEYRLILKARIRGIALVPSDAAMKVRASRE